MNRRPRKIISDLFSEVGALEHIAVSNPTLELVLFPKDTLKMKKRL